MWNEADCLDNMRTMSSANACTLEFPEISELRVQNELPKGWTGYRALSITLGISLSGLPSRVTHNNLPVSQISPHHAVEVHWAIVSEQLGLQRQPPGVVEGALYVQLFH
ncbi:hypothetical protein EVAR_57869_1 [Eumeta japonica]|uniref:Uncharacterized protein n=1 Tax=Eumeta variegata TaxID=151549 RepID=A0A4C1ZHY6_EUMVA|nr:hypothetical protein EVAR_57869_1 [Eumeta japonica]